VAQLIKRRLRAARTRAVLAAEDRAHGSPASPGSPQHGPAGHSQAPDLPNQGMVRRSLASFVAVTEELRFGPAARRLGITTRR
jgi:hypothetical protein